MQIKPEHNLGGLLTHGSVLIGNGTVSEAADHAFYQELVTDTTLLRATVTSGADSTR